MTILQDKQLVTNLSTLKFQTVINTALLFFPYVLGIDLIASLKREASSISSFKILFKRSCGMQDVIVIVPV